MTMPDERSCSSGNALARTIATKWNNKRDARAGFAESREMAMTLSMQEEGRIGTSMLSLVVRQRTSVHMGKWRQTSYSSNRIDMEYSYEM